MKLKNIKEVEAFRKVIHECEGDDRPDTHGNADEGQLRGLGF